MLDVELQLRWAEMDAARKIIGWSLTGMAEQLGLNMPQVSALKTGRRPIPDSDLDWIKQLAEFHKSNPRPTVGYSVRSDAMPEPGRDGDVPIGKMTVARELALLYRLIMVGDAMSPEEQIGARWAIGEVADKLGVADKVKSLIDAEQPPASWKPPGT